MDSNKTAREEARRQLHKNAASNLKQVLAATPTRHQLYGHLPPITKTIQVRRTRHAGHCWRSDVLLWTPTHGSAKAGRPARTYIQQLCEDAGCSPEDLPEAMNDWEKWRERVRDIRATSKTWWWWWWWWAKDTNWLIDLVFEICPDSKFPVRELLKIFHYNQKFLSTRNRFNIVPPFSKTKLIRLILFSPVKD